MIRVKIFKNFLLYILLFLIPLYCSSSDKITFSGGAPHDTFQPRIIIPLLTEAFKRNDIEFKAVYLPSIRSMESSNAGVVDGELHRVFNFHEVSDGKYPNLIRIDSELMSIWISAFSTKKIKLNSWQDLKYLNVAYYRGRKNVEKFLSTVIPENRIFKVRDDKTAFNLLAAQRIDVVISESFEGTRLIKNNYEFSDIYEVGKLDETKIFSYINKKHQHLAAKIANTLDEMKKDGTFSQIINNVLKSIK